MTRDDDKPDLLDGEPITAEERAHARALSRLVDRMLAGEPPPVAAEVTHRELLETAGTIRAALVPQPLDERRRRAVIDDVLRPATPARAPRPGAGRWAPWIVAAAAAAAALFLAVRPLSRPAPGPSAAVEVPATERSRPADALVGAIARDRAADASARMDTIFADRLAGYRDVRFRRGGAR